MCLWAAATQAAPRRADKPAAAAGVEEDDVEVFENELDAMVVEGDGDDATPEGRPSSPRRLSLLESNVNILEQDCKVAQLFVDAAASRKDNLYLGLDISTQSTGYAVLRPSTATMSNLGGHCLSDDVSHADRPGLLREMGEANLVEWGCISGNGSDGKKGDEIDVGIIVEEVLVQVAERCVRSTGGKAPAASVTTSELEESVGSGCAVKGYKKTGDAGDDLQPEADDKGRVWVVGVEDFMRRFLPGRSNAKSIFALAQLNGIIKYACHKHLGVKANSFHPSTPRSFYSLTKNKPEGKDMKQIVHDFALSQENGALHSRYEWPLSPDGSKADASYDITDAYLIARYSWHRDVFRAVADNSAAKDRFAESFRSLHSKNLLAAEKRAIEMFINGDMPAAKGKKKLKPMTERSARNAHRKLQDARFTRAYETALMEWFQQRVLGAGL
ncbi:conserved unknown protein [Ectocarpus siliculosus]|uniref:Uncharacterized protein n=1 Tax=Ectocarpus siliculosus TaxID=2880 RepID=D7FVA3_ECTSI|nr:conserved unknown protein [Ectocarpus siliculosus]|eukprot:CBJ26275.1 conserved unknown protein [Ectocarpus siliculosus]